MTKGKTNQIFLTRMPENDVDMLFSTTETRRAQSSQSPALTHSRTHALLSLSRCAVAPLRLFLAFKLLDFFLQLINLLLLILYSLEKDRC
jgi:hypothetical protein